ncbi:MAG: transposase, partial [Bacteroidales bacterium]
IYFNKTVRQHWSIENNLHWSLDVIFDEDRNLKKKENSAQNFNVVNKKALALLERENSTKASKPSKRATAALSDKYREKLIWG